jgi:predicted nucleic acid-binding protein
MIIVDTGFWLALGNRRDRYHSLAKQKLAEIRRPLITTWPVLTETCYLLLQQIGNHAQVRLIQRFDEGLFDVYEVTRREAQKIQKLMKKYESLPMGLADASLVVLAESLGTGDILSTDTRNFGAYRWSQRKLFRNLLLNS